MNIQELIKLANMLDDRKMSKEADSLDAIIKEMAALARLSKEAINGDDISDVVITPLEDSGVVGEIGMEGSDIPFPPPSEFALNREDFSYLGKILTIDAMKAGEWFSDKLENMVEEESLSRSSVRIFLDRVSDIFKEDDRQQDIPFLDEEGEPEQLEFGLEEL